MKMFALIAVLAAAGETPAAGPLPPADATTRYDECIAAVEADAESGRASAQQWVVDGGGREARHCLAIADLKAGYPRLAAARLEDIALSKNAGDEYMRARLYAQAAEAWLEGEEPEQAEKALTEAFKLAPDSGELQLTAAKTYAALERWQKVIDAVTTAEAAGFASSQTYVLRGRAYYAFGQYRTAADDVVNALELDPTDVDALVLRGDLQQTGIVIDVFYGAAEDETGETE